MGMDNWVGAEVILGWPGVFNYLNWVLDILGLYISLKTLYIRADYRFRSRNILGIKIKARRRGWRDSSGAQSPVVLAENLGSTPNTFIVAKNHL